MKRDDCNPELVPPGVDPDKLKTGIRKVAARNEASARTGITACVPISTGLN